MSFFDMPSLSNGERCRPNFFFLTALPSIHASDYYNPRYSFIFQPLARFVQSHALTLMGTLVQWVFHLKYLLMHLASHCLSGV
jgi:hypothetical protein